MRTGARAVLAGFASGAVVVSMVAIAQPSFQGLGTLPLFGVPGNYFLSAASDVSADGSIVVGFGNDGTPVRKRFRWTAGGGMQPFPQPAAFSDLSSVVRVSGNGSRIVGTYLDVSMSSIARPYAETFGSPATAMVGVTAPPGTIENADGKDISEDGTVIVGMGFFGFPDNRSRAVVWRPGTGPLGSLLTPFNGSPSGGSYGAEGVSRNGRYAVGYDQPAAGGRYRAAKWDLNAPGAAPQFIDGGWAFHSAGKAASTDGSVIVGDRYALSYYGGLIFNEMFRYTASGGMQGLGDIPGNYYVDSRANDVSGDGDVVVGESYANRYYGVTPEAIVWTAAEGLRTVKQALSAKGVETTGWRLQSAKAISKNGTVIVGYGINPQGRTEAWRAVLPRCAADFNNSGGVTAQDIFDFLAAWFTANAAADFNHSGAVTAQDLFDFLAAWFIGCP